MDTDKTQITPAPPQSVVYAHQDLTRSVIGAAMEVHSELGPGFLEKVYETALLSELAARGVRAASQAEIAVQYKGQSAGLYYADLLVDGKVLCEIKAADNLSPAHEAQLIHYLKATGLKVGLLLNFGTKRLQVKRMVF